MPKHINLFNRYLNNNGQIRAKKVYKKGKVLLMNNGGQKMGTNTSVLSKRHPLRYTLLIF